MSKICFLFFHTFDGILGDIKSGFSYPWKKKKKNSLFTNKIHKWFPVTSKVVKVSPRFVKLKPHGFQY